MVQTERLNGRIVYPDGCKVLGRKKGTTGAFIDFGINEGDTTNSAEWTESRYQSGNAGILNTRVRDMKITGKMVIVTHEADIIELIAAGIIKRTSTAGAAITPSAQTIAAGWDDGIVYPLEMISSSIPIKTGAKPVISGIAIDLATDEPLTEGNDYQIVKCSSSKCGYGIAFFSGNMTATTPKASPIVITYGSNTPITRETLSAGSTSLTLDAFELQIIQTDSAGQERGLHLFNVTPKSGGFGFNFLGQGNDGVEKMELSYEANLDTARTDGKQLYQYWIDTDFAA